MRKYILILITTFSFAQSSNQMVTFTQAQSLGFALKSGQSHVTSNQCMTKTEILAKYNVTISGYADNQLVPRSAWVALATYYTFNRTAGSGVADGGCNFGASFNNTLYCNTSSPVVGTTMYTDTAMNIPFNGANFWYGFDGSYFGLSVNINYSGQIIEFYNCMY